MDDTQVRKIMKAPKNPGVIGSTPTNPRLLYEFEYSQLFQKSPATNESASQAAHALESIGSKSSR